MTQEEFAGLESGDPVMVGNRRGIVTRSVDSQNWVSVALVGEQAISKLTRGGLTLGWPDDPAPNGLPEWLAEDREFSAKTFGPGKRTGMVTQHIAKELEEIRQKPDDLTEWVDVIILGLDGYWRHGGSPETIMADLWLKLRKNQARKWLTPKSEDEAIEHDRSDDPAPGFSELELIAGCVKEFTLPGEKPLDGVQRLLCHNKTLQMLVDDLEVANEAFGANDPAPKTPSADITKELTNVNPCPFCGCESPVNWLSHDAEPNIWCVFCPQCNAEGPHSKDEAMAVAYWNKHPEERKPTPSADRLAEVIGAVWLNRTWRDLTKEPNDHLWHLDAARAVLEEFGKG